MPVQFTTDLPDAGQPTLNNGVEDEIEVTWSDVINYGEYVVEIRETGGAAWDGTATGYQQATAAESSTSVVFSGLEDGEEYEVRLRTSTEHVAGAWTTPVSIVTIFPSPTDLTLVSDRFDSLTFEFTDHADNEQEIRLERNTGDGWQTIETYDPNTTSVTDDSPPLFENVEYRVVATTPYKTGITNTVSAIPADSDSSAWLEIEKAGTVRPIAPNRVASLKLNLEHTAISAYDVTLSPPPEGVRDYHLGEVRIFVGNERLFRGSVDRTPSSNDTITVSGDGPLSDLQEDTTRKSYTSRRAWKAIEDYVSTIPNVSWTVREPYRRTTGTDSKFLDAPTFDDFDEIIVEPPADYPLYYSRTEVRPAQSTWLLECENGTHFGTVVNEGHQGGDVSNFEAVELDFGGDIELEFTNEYKIPGDDYDLRYRASLSGFTGETVVEIDGQEVSANYYGSEYSSDMAYRRGPLDNLPDLEPGTHTVRISNNIAGTSGTGAVRFDNFVLYDELTRYPSLDPGDTIDNTIDTTYYTHSSPALYPGGVEATLRTNPYWHVNHARIEGTFSDTGGGQSIAVSNDGENYVSNSNTSNVEVDFDAQGTYGTSAFVRVTLGPYTGNNKTVSPDENDAPQTLTNLEVYLTTDDLPVIESLELDPNTWLDGVRQLHERADMRFTVDHRADGLVVESYRRGDPDVLKPDDWTAKGEDSVSFERDTSEYWNQANVYAAKDSPLTDRNFRDLSEVERVGEVVERSKTTNITDGEELAIEARSFLRKGVRGDVINGDISILPTYVSPGYPYEPSEFGGTRANLEQVTISTSGDSISASLSFGARRSLVSAFGRGAD